MDNFRKYLLMITVGVMVIAFVFTCFYFLHYNCLSDDAFTGGIVKKDGVAAKSSKTSKRSKPSKMSFSESKTPSLCSPGKQSMLSSIDKISEPSGPEKSSTPSSAEKLIKPSDSGKLSRSSKPQKLFSSSYPRKSYNTHSIEKPHKLAHAHKVAHQVHSSYPDKPIRPPWPASLQYSPRLTNLPCPFQPKYPMLPTKAFGLHQLVKSPRHRNLKKSVSLRKAIILPRPKLAQICQHYGERCLVCKASSESLVSISGVKSKDAQNPDVSGSFHKVDSRDNVYYDNVSESDTYDSDDSNREITIICNITYNEILPKDIPHG
ncbi:uncharacterized protein CXorf66 homolog [Tupaia chinensis]|uniref:uncharacterized protein CXorf66 homolog n=1 Tax=Tupaia chinensis TaxID=246437 RepID=UPI000FFB3F91|nr:uncharacterized protein CXorf66 homolog [Tupaia chinensis]